MSFQLFPKICWVGHGAQIYTDRRSCIWERTFSGLCAQPWQRVVGRRRGTEAGTCAAGSSRFDDVENIKSSTKAKVREPIVLASEWERATTTVDMYRKCRVVWTCCFWDVRANRQTNRQTRCLQYAARLRGEATSLKFHTSNMSDRFHEQTC